MQLKVVILIPQNEYNPSKPLIFISLYYPASLSFIRKPQLQASASNGTSITKKTRGAPLYKYILKFTKTGSEGHVPLLPLPPDAYG